MSAKLKKNTITPEKAIKCLKKAFKEDPDYAWSWHCVVAICSQDEGMGHAASNRAAARFMKMAFDVETKEPVSTGDDSPEVPV